MSPSRRPDGMHDMPFHNYHCQTCGRHFELLVRYDSAPVCPTCRGVALSRLPSAPVAPGKSKAIIAANRKKAAREGHLSNFSKTERGPLPR